MRIGIAVVVFGVLAGCAAPKPAPSNAAPSGIVWVVQLDHASTPESHRAAAIELLEASGSRQAMNSMQELTLTAQMKQNPTLAPYEATMREFLGKYASFDAMREDLAQLYMRKFSELELRQMTAFYNTAAGQKAVHELPQLFDEGAKIGAAKVREHQAELVEMMQHQPKPLLGK